MIYRNSHTIVRDIRDRDITVVISNSAKILGGSRLPTIPVTISYMALLTLQPLHVLSHEGPNTVTSVDLTAAMDWGWPSVEVTLLIQIIDWDAGGELLRELYVCLHLYVKLPHLPNFR